MKVIEKFFKGMDHVAFFCAALSVAGMLFCVTLQVVARKTTLSANWTTELSQYCFLWSTTFASYIAARKGKLISVELLQNMMPSFVRRIMRFISWASCAFFYGLVIYFCMIQLPRLMSQKTPVLQWSMGMIYVVMMLGLLMLALYSAYLAVVELLKKDTGAEKKEKTVEEILEEVD